MTFARLSVFFVMFFLGAAALANPATWNYVTLVKHPETSHAVKVVATIFAVLMSFILLWLACRLVKFKLEAVSAIFLVVTFTWLSLEFGVIDPNNPHHLAWWFLLTIAFLDAVSAAAATKDNTKTPKEKTDAKR